MWAPSVFPLLQDEHPRAFARHKAVAPQVKGTGGLFGRLIAARAHGLGSVESSHADRRERRFGAAGEHRVTVAAPDNLNGLADGVSTGGAGRDRHPVGPLAAKANRQNARAQVGDDLRDQKRRNAPRSDLAQPVASRLHRGDAAHARADDTADARRVFPGDFQPRGLLGHQTSGEHVLLEGIESPRVLAVHPAQGIEALHLTGNARLVTRGVKPRDWPNAVLARDERLPRLLRADAERGDEADAGDDDASGHWSTLGQCALM